jgi:hypothetical protein
LAAAIRSVIRHTGVILAVALTVSAVAPVQPASAQGLFDALFGNFRRPQRSQSESSAFADPFGPFGGESRRSAGGDGFGRGVVFCVRTCDGRYFPLQRHANTSPAEMCRAFCPAAKTMVFTGSKIDTAVAQNGIRYADLDNAFAYRDKVGGGCTCTGHDGGLARLDTLSDPTLRPGDIVATDTGLATYTGSANKTAEFTPINMSSSEWARRLAEVKIDPAPPTERIEPVVNEDTKPPLRRTRFQAAR